MSQYILDCPNSDTCTMQPYSAPPATVDHYSLAPTWVWVLVVIVALAFILATSIVRYRAHEEKGLTDRQRIAMPPKQCPTCGDKVGG